MDGKGDTLLKMHLQSAPYGVALNPTLRDKLLAYYDRLPDGVTPLDRPMHSAGPAHQVISQADLAQPNVVRLQDHRDISTLVGKRTG
ncbi:MAG: hypothetical protein MK098_13405 [Marinovum sp.]|nr:hypothetical protein [Marinovum sp.]